MMSTQPFDRWWERWWIFESRMVETIMRISVVNYLWNLHLAHSVWLNEIRSIGLTFNYELLMVSTPNSCTSVRRCGWSVNVRLDWKGNLLMTSAVNSEWITDQYHECTDQQSWFRLFLLEFASCWFLSSFHTTFDSRVYTVLLIVLAKIIEFGVKADNIDWQFTLFVDRFTKVIQSLTINIQKMASNVIDSFDSLLSEWSMQIYL